MSQTPGTLLAALRAEPPLVQCITNYVAMNIAANVLLAAGASPAMVSDAEEAGEFAGIAGALDAVRSRQRRMARGGSRCKPASWFRCTDRGQPCSCRRHWGLKMMHVTPAMAAGARGVAVVSAICGQLDPEAAARALAIEIGACLSKCLARCFEA